MPGILIIEDDITFSQIIEGFLSRKGYQVYIAHNIKEGKKLVEDADFDIALLDYRLPDGTGIEVLSHLHTLKPTLPVIIMTGFHDIRTAVKAMRQGAYDFITKPVNPDELLMLLEEAQKGKREPKASGTGAPSFIVGNAEAGKQLYDHVKLVAPTDISVILQGESGTGKEQAARTIHKLSKRAAGPFVAVDCGALSPELAASELYGHLKGAFTGALQDKQGHFESANGGTLFLDEVGNLSYEVQVKLLRAVQEREIQPLGSNKLIKIDVRIITATNDDLLVSVKEGDFREDLYHRLNEFKIKMPSLRERLEDLDLFVSHFMAQASSDLEKSVTKLSKEVRQLFMRYNWPGNLREMKNIIKRAVLLSDRDTIEMSALPDEMVLAADAVPDQPATNLKLIHSNNERELIMKTLQEVKFNKSKAARLLNIDRKTLYYKMSKYDIEG